MAGLERVAGIGPRVTLNGKDYQVRGKTNRFYAEVKAEIQRMRGDPFDMIVEAGVRGKLGGDPDLLENVADTVADKFRNWGIVTYRDYLDFMRSAEGDILTAYHCLVQDDPTVTLDAVRDYILTMKFKGLDDESAREEILALFRAIKVASGEDDELGNSNGQTKKLVTTGT